MTTQTDTAPLSARLRAYGDSHLKGCPQVITEAADALDALSARVKDWELAASEEYGAEMEGIPITPNWLRSSRHEGMGRLNAMAIRIKELCLSLGDAEARATQAEAERDALKAAHSASQAREAGMRALLANASRFVRHLAESESDAEIYASATACEAEIDAALSPAQPAQSPGIALAARLAGQPDATLDAELAAFARAAVQPAQGADPLVFGYTNWRGEHGTRRAIPIRVYHGSTEYHPEPQWLMEAHDLDKDAVRIFAMQDMGPAQGAGIARDLADALADTMGCVVEVERAYRQIGHGHGMADAKARKEKGFSVLAKARAAGLLTTETEGSK